LEVADSFQLLKDNIIILFQHKANFGLIFIQISAKTDTTTELPDAGYCFDVPPVAFRRDPAGILTKYYTQMRQFILAAVIKRLSALVAKIDNFSHIFNSLPFERLRNSF
jgi:hypothetical protein